MKGDAMLKCTLLGHSYEFTADGPTLLWLCARGCGAGGRKTYPDAAHARRYANAFNKRDSDDIGRRAPILGMFPLRIWRALKRPRQ